MMSNKQIIFFFYESGAFYFPNRQKVKAFVHQMFKREKTPLQSLNYIFCTDEYLLEINKSYLGHNYYTDIITFNLASSGPITGEIYISIERIKENAKDLGTSFKQELHRVIFHGALHLCGYDDKTNGTKKVMTEKEDHYLSLYFK